MTRYTNLGRKRTYVEAGFNLPNEGDIPAQTPAASTSSVAAPQVLAETSLQPQSSSVDTSTDTGTPSEKRKRIRSKKRKDGSEGQNEEIPAGGEADQSGNDEGNVAKESLKSEKVKKANSKLKDKKKAKRVKGAFASIFFFRLRGPPKFSL